MDVQSLFAIQEKLDQKIKQNHNLGENEDFIPAKVLALYVELGELANETRCFKYWSVKPPSAKEMILEEYVDGLHFVLSLGLSLNYQNDVRVEVESVRKNRSQLEAFEEAFRVISDFSKELSFSNYQTLFQSIIHLGQVLGFSWPEIKQAYLAKNEVNHKRQEEGY